jgi:hypothetical protein
MALWTFWIRLRHAPYGSLVLAAAGLVIAVLYITDLPFALIGNGLSVFSIGQTLTAIALWSLFLQIVARRLPLSARHILIWWARPLMKFVYGLVAFSLVMMLVAAVYPVNGLNLLVNGLLLTALSASIYSRQRHPIWLVAVVAIAWLTWMFGLKLLNLEGVHWHTIPLAIVLLGLARMRGLKGAGIVETAAIVILLAGGFAGLRMGGVLFAAGLSLGTQLLALVIYGYLGGRRVPFGLGLLILGGGLAALVIRVNFWFFILGAGIALLGCALLMEVQRKAVERWFGDWKMRWQAWQ